MSYYCEYEVVTNTRPEVDCIDVKGSWLNAGTTSGFCICTANNVEQLHEWLRAWTDKVHVWPIIDDNVARKIITGSTEHFQVSYDNVFDEPSEDESLYVIKFKFHEQKKMVAFDCFATMNERQHREDAFGNKSLGRWHNLSEGTGIILFKTNSVEDLHLWSFKWAPISSCEIKAIVRDVNNLQVYD